MNDRRYTGRQGAKQSRFTSDTVLTERLYVFLGCFAGAGAYSGPDRDRHGGEKEIGTG
jgi:hypothetical protein